MIIKGDCIEEMKKLEENSVDAIVTDPPYGLEFMGKDWDKFGVSPARAKRLLGDDNVGTGDKFFDHRDGAGKRGRYTEMDLKEKNSFQEFIRQFSTECLRVLKPGGFLLSFGGTRTYHRLVCGIEDAGFEIRDTIMWLYGSGFPKSLNIGKQIDKMGEENKKYSELNKELCDYLKESREKLNLNQKEIAKHFLSKTGGLTGCVWNWENGLNIPTIKQWEKLKELLRLDNHKFNVMIERAIVKRIEAKREVIGKDGRTAKDSIFGIGVQEEWDLTKPATPEAKQWEGWGTALKPACEPIVVARKPLSEKNVALNVLKWGTGGINIDATRIGSEVRINKGMSAKQPECAGTFRDDNWKPKEVENIAKGRFPANIILDEEAGRLLDEQSGNSTTKPHGGDGKKLDTQNMGWGFKRMPSTISDKGGASRFFYCAKASKSERNFGCEELNDKKIDIQQPHNSKDLEERYSMTSKNNHPTVKPIKLMEYLIKLVSKEGAVVLDPFLGSGTTAIACQKLNRKWIGIEKEDEYIAICGARLNGWKEELKKRGIQKTLI